jgi:hypothetical protein
MFAQLCPKAEILERGRGSGRRSKRASACEGMTSCDQVQISYAADYRSTIVNLFFIIAIISRGQNLVLLASYHKSPCDVWKPGC